MGRLARQNLRRLLDAYRVLAPVCIGGPASTTLEAAGTPPLTQESVIAKSMNGYGQEERGSGGGGGHQPHQPLSMAHHNPGVPDGAISRQIPVCIIGNQLSCKG